MSGIALPDAWCLAHIDDIAEVKGGKRLPKGESFSDHKTDHPYLRVTDFTAGGIDQSKLKYISDITHAKISLYTISKDDLYISIAGTIGQVGVIPQDLDGANLTENAAKICSIYYLDKGYLAKLLNSEYSKQQFIDNTVSSGQPKLALFRIKECSLPIAPLAEQKEIAARLDNLLAQVDSIKTRLDSIPTILKRFRQSVLAAAVSGKLTKEWRSEHAHEWATTTLGSIIKEGPQNGIYKPSTLYGSGTKIIRIDGFYDGEITAWEGIKRVQLEDQEIAKWQLNVSDILINRVNSIEYLGKCGLVRELPETAVFESNIMRVTLDADSALPEYVTLFLTSLIGLERLRENAKLAVNQASINQGDVKGCVIELPKLDEQTEIVRRVEQLFTFADQIEQRVKEAQSRVNNLTQSILAKAFRGELTADWREQNPDLISGENTAEALLEKIKSEREVLESTKKVFKRKKAKV